jgi:Electron transfer DM13
MKTTIFAALLTTAALSGCVKNEALTPATPTTLPATVNITKALGIGDFMNGTHPTTGSVKILEDSQDKTKKYLVFENFKTDAGPDLKIYLSEDVKAAKFIEISKLENTGNFNVLIPTSADLDKQKYVLIWCKQFSVLFGSAQLK